MPKGKGRTTRLRNKAELVRKPAVRKAFGGACQNCGYNKTDSALAFHHVDPSTKEYHINKSWGQPKKLYKELKKCVMVCSNCHAEIHAGVTEAPAILAIDFMEVEANILETSSSIYRNLKATATRVNNIIITPKYGIKKLDKMVYHGTVSGYQKCKCRCDDCKKASAKYLISIGHIKKQRVPAEHGTIGRYGRTSDPCRCDACKKANSDYLKEYRKRLKERKNKDGR